MSRLSTLHVSAAGLQRATSFLRSAASPRSVRRLARRSLAMHLLALVVLSACAPTRVRLSPEEARSTFGRIAIATIDGPGTAFDRPATSRGKAAASGAAAAVGMSAMTTIGVSGPFGVAIFIISALLSTPVAAIHGAIAAKSPEAVERAARDLETAVTELRIPDSLRDLVILQMKREQYADVVAFSGGAETTVPSDVDTIIEIHVPAIVLQGRGVNPKLKLYVPATVRILKADVEVRTASLSAGGTGHKFLHWARDDARQFRQQLGVELENLARQISDEVLSRPRRGSVSP